MAMARLGSRFALCPSSPSLRVPLPRRGRGNLVSLRPPARAQDAPGIPRPVESLRRAGVEMVAMRALLAALLVFGISWAASAQSAPGKPPAFSSGF